MKVLKFELYQPAALYRIPYSQSRWLTYISPPYSTIIGFFCNILGEKSLISSFLQSTNYIAVYSKFLSKSKSYSWLRNLSKNRVHVETEHIGSQSPIILEELNDVHLNIYLYSEQKDFYGKLIQNSSLPEKWLHHLHLGRSEDWAQINNIKVIDIVKRPIYGRLEGSTWVANPNDSLYETEENSHYKEFYSKLASAENLISSLYEIKKISFKSDNKLKVNYVRNFNYIPSKLIYNNDLPYSTTKNYEFYIDDDVPLFFTKIKKR